MSKMPLTRAKGVSSSCLPGAHWPLVADGSLLVGNSWRTEPLAVLDSWSEWLTLELKVLRLGLWIFGGDMTTVLQAFREERAGEE